MTEMGYQEPVWWGTQSFEPGQGRHWHMAGMNLCIIRQIREWQFQINRTPAQGEDNHAWHRDEQLPENPLGELSRYVFGQTSGQLTLLPRMADRSIVVRPVMPLFVPPGQDIIFYVSTPVWLSCLVEGRDTPLIDIPIVRPADTWFGPNTVKGELCYATQVTGRLELNHLSKWPFRAVTPVRISNNSNTFMPVERINLPVPFLPVYASASGRLWTPILYVTTEERQKVPRIRIDTNISTEAGEVTLLSPARRGTEEHALIRVFDNLFD